MNILTLTSAYEPFVGGAELSIKYIAQNLPEENFTILTPRKLPGLPSTEVHGNIKVVRIGFGHSIDKHLFPVLAFFWFWRAEKFDLVWAMMANQAGFAAMLIRQTFGTPYLLTLQEGDSQEWIDRRRKMMLGLYERIYTHADRITTISDFLQQRAIGFGVDRSKIDIVPNGFDPGIFKRDPHVSMNTVRGKLSIPQGKFVLVTASRLVKKNGIDLAIRAVAAVEDAILYIAGDGPDKDSLRSLVKELKAENKVVFLGEVEQKQLPQYFLAADAFIRLSRSEGLGSAFLEAFAVGLPVIASDADAIPEIVKDGENGFLIPKETYEKAIDAIKELKTNTAKREQISQNAEHLVKTYEWPNIANQIRKVFQKFAPTTPKQKRRIVVATPLFAPQIGGPATYCEFLSENFKDSEFEFTFVMFSDFSHLPKGIRHLRIAYEIYKKSRIADVVYALDPVSTGLPAVIAAKLARKKFIVKVVGDYAWEQGVQKYGVREGFPEFWNNRYGFAIETLRKVESFVTRHADLVIVPSEFTREMVKRFGADLWAIKVIRNSMPAHVQEALVKKDHLIVSAGRLLSFKGFEVLMEAVSDLKNEFPHIELKIAGDGPYRDKLDAKIISLQASSYITIIPSLPNKELLSLIASANAFVLNSACENFSHVLVESLASGTVTAASNVGGNPEIVQNERTGLLFEYNNKDQIKEMIRKIFIDKSLKEKFDPHINEFLVQLDPKVTASKLQIELTNLTQNQ